MKMSQFLESFLTESSPLFYYMNTGPIILNSQTISPGRGPPPRPASSTRVPYGLFFQNLATSHLAHQIPKISTGQRDPSRRSYGRFPQILCLINIKKYVIIKKKTFLIHAHLKTLKIFVII